MIKGWSLFHGEEFCIGSTEIFSDVVKYVEERLPRLKPIDFEKSMWKDSKDGSIWTIRYLYGNEKLDVTLIGMK